MKITGKIILASLIMALASFAVSCGGATLPSDNDSDDIAGNHASAESPEAVQEEAEAETNASNILNRFEQTNYGGAEFRIVASKLYNGSIGGQQIPGEEINGEILNDALYNRDRTLEEYFNISVVYNTIDYEENSPIASMISQNVAAGDDTADLVWGSIDMVMKPLLTGDRLVDLRNLPNLDLSNEWWLKTVTEDLSINGKVYFASGNITPRATTSAFIFVFNKKLLGDYQIEEPYEDVRSGKWTLDRLQTICQDAYQDFDGSGQTSDDDFFGLVFEGGSLGALYTGAGGTIFELQSDNTPVMTADSSRNVDVLENLSEMLQLKTYYVPNVNYVANRIFRESRALFLSMACCDLSMLRDMETDYGILPQPKFDESQEEYYCAPNKWIATGIAVPKSLPESEYERVGLLTEAMAALSTYTSYEAQYETIMQARYVRDTDSIEMLRLAVESSRFDMGNIYGWGGLDGTIENIMRNGGEIVSAFERSKKIVNSQVNKFLKTLDEFE